MGSPPGRGLFRWSVSWVVEEVGVALLEPAGEWLPEPLWEGDEVPEFAESLDFLDDLFESLARESCSC